MKLKDMIINLQKLEQEGHGDKQIFCVCGSSGTTYELSSAHISDYVGESGPFDLEDGEEYISIYGGN